MKTILRTLAVLSLFALTRAEALTIYRITQSGYSNGITISGVIKITDDNYGGVISTAQIWETDIILDAIGPWVRGFDSLVALTNFNTVTGAFDSLTVNGFLTGTTATLTMSGGTLTSYNVSVGQYFTIATSQAPTVICNTPDGGWSALLLIAAIGVMAAFRHRSKVLGA